jgi:microcystin-dependent protein
VANPYLGEIRIFPYNFAPSGWAICEGQVLSISQNTALFALIGTFYGGNGTSTFALPDLRGRVPLGQGQGVGLSSFTVGQVGGVEDVTLITSQIPAHNHPVTASEHKGTSHDAGGNVLALGTKHEFATAPDGTIMNAAMISPTGGGAPHENHQPYLALTPCIALQGIFPSRN